MLVKSTQRRLEVQNENKGYILYSTVLENRVSISDSKLSSTERLTLSGEETLYVIFKGN